MHQHPQMQEAEDYNSETELVDYSDEEDETDEED